MLLLIDTLERQNPSALKACETPALINSTRCSRMSNGLRAIFEQRSVRYSLTGSTTISQSVASTGPFSEQPAGTARSKTMRTFCASLKKQEFLANAS